MGENEKGLQVRKERTHSGIGVRHTAIDKVNKRREAVLGNRKPVFYTIGQRKSNFINSQLQCI